MSSEMLKDLWVRISIKSQEILVLRERDQLGLLCNMLVTKDNNKFKAKLKLRSSKIIMASFSLLIAILTNKYKEIVNWYKNPHKAYNKSKSHAGKD